MASAPHPTDDAPRTRSLALLVAALASLIGLATWWYLEAERPDRPPAPRGPGQTAPLDSGDAPDPALLAPDGRNAASARADFALPGGIEIPAGVRLAGPGVLSGRALDRASGLPLPGVRVDLLPLPPAGAAAFGRMLHLANTGDDLESRVEPIAITGTDAAGNFQFEGVRVGRYFLAARGTRHVPDGIAPARVLASGRGGPVDVWLREGGRVLGVVLGPDGDPAPGARLALTAGPTFAIEAARTGDMLYLETQSDSAGAFAFCGVPEGPDFQVTASGGAFALTHLPDIRVRAGEDTRVTLRTQRGARIEGRVVSAPGAGEEAASAAPAPVEGAHVGAVPRGLRALPYAAEVLQATHAVTGADGRYSMSWVPPGEIDVLAIAPGHVPARGPSVIASDGGTTVAADFDLPRGPLVSGRVVDGAGAPIEGVVARWNVVDLRNFDFDFSFAPLLGQAVEGFEFPRTDADGRFTAGAFPGEPPFLVEFTRLGYQGARAEWNPAQGSELTVVMHRGGAVEGVVMDSAKHAPVESFVISGWDRIDGEAGGPGRRNPYAGGQEVEHPHGRFRVDSVQPGRRSLVFSAAGYAPNTVADLEIVEGDVLRGVIVELSPGGVVRGTVKNKEGAPVAGAQVFANAGRDFRGERDRFDRRRGPFAGESGAGTERVGRPEDLPTGMSGFLAQLGFFGDRAALSRTDGTFELGGLELGGVTLYASHRDYVLARAEPVQLRADAPAPEVSLVLSRGSGIFGTATDRFGRPVQGAIVLALSPANLAGQNNASGGGLYQGNTDAEGRYSIDHVSSGSYFVVLTRGDEALRPMSFLGTLNFDLLTVPPDERVQKDIVDTSSGACRVSGLVRASGELVTSGSVAALGFESDNLLGVDFKLAQLEEDGTYEFAGLAPGEYTFQVTETARGKRGDPIRLSVEIPDLPEVRLDLELPRGAIEGVVAAQEGGLPLDGCELILARDDAPRPSGLFGQLVSRDNGVARTRTNARGEFAFDRLQAGDYRISLRPPRRGKDEAHFAQPRPFRVALAEAEALRDVRIELAPALAITGFVRRTGGEPIEGAEVLATAKEPAGLLPERARSDGEGRFRIENLPAGVYDVSADKDGFATVTERGRTLAESAGEDMVLVLAQGVEVTVRVLSAEGQPVAGASGSLVSEGGEPRGFSDAGRMLTSLFAGKGVSDSKGLLSLGNFAPGSYTLEVERGPQSARQVVALEEGPPVTLTVRLP